MKQNSPTFTQRRDKINYYLDIAETVLSRSTCLRRMYGAVIVNNDQIVSTGYSGAPRGRANCNELGNCRREALEVPRGTHYELCRSVHAEANAIIHAPRTEMLGSTLYLVGQEKATGEYVKNASSCEMCKRMVINAGIQTVVVRDTKQVYRTIDVESQWIAQDDSLGQGVGY